MESDQCIANNAYICSNDDRVYYLMAINMNTTRFIISCYFINENNSVRTKTYHGALIRPNFRVKIKIYQSLQFVLKRVAKQIVLFDRYGEKKYNNFKNIYTHDSKSQKINGRSLVITEIAQTYFVTKY